MWLLSGNVTMLTLLHLWVRFAWQATGPRGWDFFTLLKSNSKICSNHHGLTISQTVKEFMSNFTPIFSSLWLSAKDKSCLLSFARSQREEKCQVHIYVPCILDSEMAKPALNLEARIKAMMILSPFLCSHCPIQMLSQMVYQSEMQVYKLRCRSSHLPS